MGRTSLSGVFHRKTRFLFIKFMKFEISHVSYVFADVDQGVYVLSISSVSKM